MAANKKLTAVLAGRTLAGVVRHGATAVLHFDDGSVMTVQTADPSGAAGDPSASTSAARAGPVGTPSGRIRGVRQRGTTLDIDFDDGSTLTLRTAEPTSSVIVRAQDQTLEYAD